MKFIWIASVRSQSAGAYGAAKRIHIYSEEHMRVALLLLRLLLLLLLLLTRLPLYYVMCMYCNAISERTTKRTKQTKRMLEAPPIRANEKS